MQYFLHSHLLHLKNLQQLCQIHRLPASMFRQKLVSLSFVHQHSQQLLVPQFLLE